MHLNSLYGKGSSPLARGLQIIPLGRISPRRIIPARAGFTTSRTCAGRSSPDHPRSRGVYETVRRSSSPMSGSSPLARGLPLAGFFLAAYARIIPARAGFTRIMQQSRRAFQDHPRSRGVYQFQHPFVFKSLGSSPLARGLPLRFLSRRPRPGIIPARAGFTNRFHVKHSSKKDHPRSRGVYATNIRTCGGPFGSSPLARGLRLRRQCKGSRVGIIPARAGFTPDEVKRLYDF